MYSDPEKQRLYGRKHYRDNKQYYIDKQVERKKRIRDWFLEYRKSLKCVVCGEDHPACLDFHHNDPSIKEKGVTEMVWRSWSKSRIIREIEKCTVMCSNCHRKFHYNE